MNAKKLILVALVALIAFPSLAIAQGYGGYTSGGGGVSAKPGMVLPDTIYVATGREMNIYCANLQAVAPWAASTNVAANGLAAPGASPFFYSFDSVAGTLRNRSFRWTPTAEVDSALTITAYDVNGKRLESATTVLSAVDNENGTGKKNCLFIGDSTFDDTGPLIIAEVDSLFSLGTGGDILPIGTQVDNGYMHEAYGGKGWSYFTTNPSGPFWFGGRLDFNAYMADAGLPGAIDLVCVNLGGNDANVFALTNGRAMTAADVDTGVIAHAKAFVDAMMNATYGYPQAQIVFNIMQPPSAWASAVRANGGTENPRAIINFQASMREITKAFIREFDGCRYGSHVDVSLGGLWVDTVLGYPTATLASSAARIADDELVGTNYLHMDADGKRQMADALYSALQFAHDKSPATCTNQLANSSGFTNNTYWGGIASPYTQWVGTGGQPDPWGGNDAMLFTGSATVAAGYWASTTITNLNTITEPDVVVSAFVKNVNLATTESSALRIYNSDITTLANLRINWTATPTVTALAGCTDYGLDDVGGGWWRIWIYKDLSAISDANRVLIQFDPCMTASVSAGDAMVCGGIMTEYGVVEPCAVGDLYVRKP